MKKLYNLGLLSLLLLVLSCSKEPGAQPDAPEKPTPQGSKKVTITVDKAYDLSGSIAVGLLDSTLMTAKEPGLYIPATDTSVAVFLDKRTKDVMAIVRTYPQRPQIQVTAATVTEGLYDLLPAYHTLEPTLQRKFESEAPATQAYKEVYASVDNLLKAHKTVYSPEADFVQKIAALNRHIIKVYLNDLTNVAILGDKAEAGRSAKNVFGANPEDIKSWLKKDENLIENQVYGHIGVAMIPSQGATKTMILKPRPLFRGQSTESFAKYSDNYYQISLSQSRSDVVAKNKQEIVDRIIEMGVGALIGVGTTSCHGKVRDIIATKAVMVLDGNTTASDVPQLVFQVISESRKGIRDMVVADDKCGISLLLSAISSKLSWVGTALTIGYTARDIAEVAGFIKAIKEPVERTERLQIYYGKMLSGHAKVVVKEGVKAMYEKGEVAKPVVEIIRDYSFDEFALSGFVVEWKVEAENGTVSPMRFQTDGTGLAKQNWTMPNINDKVVALVAEVRDNEGKHILGSPIRFTTLVNCKNPISMGFLGLNNEKVNIVSPTLTIREYSMDFRFSDPCNMLSKAGKAELLITWTNASDGVPHPSSVDLKQFAGQPDFTYSAGGAVHWYYNPTTKQYCCPTSYTYELLVDGKSYGRASAVSPGP